MSLAYGRIETHTAGSCPDLVQLALSLVGIGRSDGLLERAVGLLEKMVPHSCWAVLDRVGERRFRASATAGVSADELRKLTDRACGPDAWLSIGQVGSGEGPERDPRWHCVPSGDGGTEPGVVLATWSGGAGPSARVEFLAQAARLVAGFLHSAKTLEAMEDRSTRDPLTGMLNRRGILDTLRREYARADRHGHPLSVLFLDLDGFKDINDVYGHLVGDEVLAGVSAVLTRSLRASDTVGRIGGDEFLVLLPDTGAAAARQLAARLTWTVENSAVRTSCGAFLVRMTAGASSMSEASSGEQLLELADRRMLRRKRERGSPPPPEPRSRGKAVEIHART